MLDSAVKNDLVTIVGEDRYIDQIEILTCYSYDSFLEESMPDAVIFPLTTEEVSEIMQVASKSGVPVTARGAGTSVCGAPIAAEHGIVLCFSKMDKIIDINTRDRHVIVQPGLINGDLQRALAPLGFFFPPDPGSMNFSTIGGNVALNAGGPRCLKYGVTVDYVLGMQVVLASGKIVRFGSKNIKDVTGYNFTSLFCGSEGTLGLVTEITLRVVPQPETTQTLLVTFDNLDNTAQAVSDVIGSGILPVSMELMDKMTINAIEDSVQLGLPREAEGSLLIEVDGSREACDREREQIIEKVQEHGAVSIEEAQNQEDRDRLWAARRAAYGVFAKIAPDILSEDVTVPVSKVPDMIRKIYEITGKYNLKAGVLAHAGDGNMHPLICADRTNTIEWMRVEKAFREIFVAAASLDGTLSGEHGIGLAKAEFLPLVMDQNSRDFMSLIKNAVDPDNILNPGKFV
ncbi:FAD-binding oxidoreductase [Desulfosediminicola flagellatus]|uniref:FAD-binding oxidoreductase n=1 Tax=Desulfosediminicola flagellatus TaxID=2569541 RepID=UPI0010AC2412|nr:FAD-linked oxidase C-terminal domain-containing protein [Desulfosediminicola flagellatus]